MGVQCVYQGRGGDEEATGRPHRNVLSVPMAADG